MGYGEDIESCYYKAGPSEGKNFDLFYGVEAVQEFSSIDFFSGGGGEERKLMFS
jgi:hypothetical protein